MIVRRLFLAGATGTLLAGCGGPDPAAAERELASMRTEMINEVQSLSSVLAAASIDTRDATGYFEHRGTTPRNAQSYRASMIVSATGTEAAQVEATAGALAANGWTQSAQGVTAEVPWFQLTHAAYRVNIEWARFGPRLLVLSVATDREVEMPEDAPPPSKAREAISLR